MSSPQTYNIASFLFLTENFLSFVFDKQTQYIVYLHNHKIKSLIFHCRGLSVCISIYTRHLLTCSLNFEFSANVTHIQFTQQGIEHAQFPATTTIYKTSALLLENIHLMVISHGKKQFSRNIGKMIHAFTSDNVPSDSPCVSVSIFYARLHAGENCIGWSLTVFRK